MTFCARELAISVLAISSFVSYKSNAQIGPPDDPPRDDSQSKVFSHSAKVPDHGMVDRVPRVLLEHPVFNIALTVGGQWNSPEIIAEKTDPWWVNTFKLETADKSARILIRIMPYSVIPGWWDVQPKDLRNEIVHATNVLEGTVAKETGRHEDLPFASALFARVVERSDGPSLNLETRHVFLKGTGDVVHVSLACDKANRCQEWIDREYSAVFKSMVIGGPRIWRNTVDGGKYFTGMMNERKRTLPSGGPLAPLGDTNR